MSLRRASLVFATLLAFIGVGVAMSLIIVTSRLHRAAHQIGTSVESVRIGEELQFALVALRDANEPLAQRTGEQLLRRHLADAPFYVGSPHEQSVVARLGKQIDAYVGLIGEGAARGEVSAAERSAAFETAFASAHEWLGINIEQSRAAVGTAARLDALAKSIGLAALVTLIVGLGGIAWWLQQRTFRPARKLVGAIDRYAQGDRSARAIEQGPEEFRSIAHRFNDMASNLERQREGQLAFLAGVAHDLRNPVSVLKLATAMISPDQPLPPEDRMRHLFGRVQRQIDRIERMANDLLDASQIESGHLALQLEDCDVRDLARAVVDLFEPAARSHQLVVSLPDRAARLMCDPVRIEQVLTNLVSNALKYSPGGGAVRVAVRAYPDTVEVAVTDEGIGMSADDMEQVFEPFRRTGAGRDSIPGVGLGLYVTRKIVEAHGGRIAVKSVLGEGSTFTVQLPISTKRDPALTT